MRRFVIGTAGHVDHGKTTLVHALTGIDTDRLPEEKRRGITIELGFAPWRIPGSGSGDDLSVSIVDVPGHRRLVHTMIAGASGIELVLLVVAADEGVMPQTREHLAALRLLGLSRAVVAITKVDRVERELADLAGEEVRELCAGTLDVRGLHLVSAKTGEGLGELSASVRAALLELPPRPKSVHAELWIDRSFSVRGAGAVVTGTLVRGSLALGTEVRVVTPAHADREGRTFDLAVRGLHVHDASVERAEAPTRLAVNLAGASHEDLSRGSVVTTDPSVRPRPVVDVEVVEIAGARPLRSGGLVTFYSGTAHAPARFRWLARSEDGGRARVRLLEPLPVRGGDRFVLRGSERTGASGAVRGGGRVLDAGPPVDRRSREPHLALLAATTLEETARSLLAEASARGVPDGSLGSRLPVLEAELRPSFDALAATGDATRIKGFGFVLAAAAAELASRTRAIVAAFHRERPLERGMSVATLRGRLADRAHARVVDEALRLASTRAFTSEQPPIVQEGDVVRLSTFSTEAGDRSRAAASVFAAVEASGLTGVTERAASESLALPSKDLRTMLSGLQREGRAKSIADLWFAQSVLDGVGRAIVDHFAKNEVLTIATFKEITGVGRRQAIPLLEHFDREGVTRRSGDDRVAGPRGRGT